MKTACNKIIAIISAIVTILSVVPNTAFAVNGTTIVALEAIQNWLQPRDEEYGEFGSTGKVGSFGGNFSSNQAQNYYTTPTSSEEDQYGNVINYYRGGDTTSTKIIDSYNHTFNTIHNTTNNTNNYTANLKLSDFLNTYTTNNNNYTYNTDYNSWYYDNTQNTLNYSDDDTYYAYDNRQYYVSIDNSTDEYYLVDIQYSPTFVTVNYDYHNINVDNSVNVGDVTINADQIGDVTNIYYFELTDGRNSSALTADEVAGLDLGFDVVNYELVTDDPNTLSLQHFDGDYIDSSSYGRTFYSENRSTNYVDTGSFNKGLYLPSGSAAGVTIPGMSDYGSLTFDFRIRYSDISYLGIYFGNTNIFQEILPTTRKWIGKDIYSDNGVTFPSSSYIYFDSSISLDKNTYYDVSFLNQYWSSGGSQWPNKFEEDASISSAFVAPESYFSPGFEGEDSYVKKYGWMTFADSTPSLFSSETYFQYSPNYTCIPASKVVNNETVELWQTKGTIKHYNAYEYRWSPSQYIQADFSYSAYANQWVSMRITIDGGKLYYFVNGDLAGSGAFTMPSADKFYIKSSGTLYLDELRITTGDMVSSDVYTLSSEPFDTNKVLALPSELTADTIYVRHSTPVTSWRIGGVRPSNPSTGFFYIPLHSDQAQLYDGSNWVDVDAVVYDGSTTTSVVGYTFTPMGASSDVDTDLEPGRPVQPGEDVDQDSCTHSWEETSRTDSTCILPGSVIYTCSKCNASKTESLVKLNHTWEVKQSVQTSYDESGNVLTEGFTIYRCTTCNEEYKDTEGTGPPMVDSSDDADSGGNWFSDLMTKIGEFLGTTIGGLIDLISTVINKVLDSLITLAEATLAKLTEVVNLFGSFGDALGILWSWLPEDIVTVLVAGVTIIIFVSVIKLFFR